MRRTVVPELRLRPKIAISQKFGFPWILSSESSLINGLHGNFCEIIFVAVLPWRGRFIVGRLEIVG
jgi:hypothetical protein